MAGVREEAEEHKRAQGPCAPGMMDLWGQWIPDPFFTWTDMKNPFLTAPALPGPGLGMALKETLACHILGKPSSIFD